MTFGSTQNFQLRALFLTAVLFLYGCASRPDYKPHRQSVPLFTEKGQFQGGFYASRGLGVHLAFSPMDHLGVTLQTNLQGGTELFEAEEQSLYQMGIGTFLKFSSGVVAESYLIGGVGRYRYSEESFYGDSESASARMWRVALQPAFGYKSKQVEVALSSRIGYLGYANIHGNAVSDSVEIGQYFRDHSRNLLLEPALTVRLFASHFGIECQYGRSVGLSKPKLTQEDSWGSFSFLWRLPGEKIPPGR